MPNLTDIDDRIDEQANEYMAWTCVLCIGMFFPAQFEAILSRYYMGMTIREEANWMSINTRNAKKLNKRALRNVKIVACYLQKCLEAD